MNDESIRIFFALWPDAKTRRKIFQAYHSIEALADRGRAVRIQNLHMTLHFIGNIPARELDCYIAAGDQVRSRPFTLQLAASGSFRKAQVAWLGCHVFPVQLSDLYRQLQSNLLDCDYRAEERVFRPHVTMARKVRDEAAGYPVEAVRWPVDRFVLLQSMPAKEGVLYRVRHSWPLLD